MRDEVTTESFWEWRIKEAENIGQEHYAVYNASKTLWNEIEKAHKSIINTLCEGKVLDAGCGYGRCSEWIDDYVGVDFSGAFIEMAKKKYPDKEFIQSRLEKLPFKDKEFDWAFCISIKNMIIGRHFDWNAMEKELKRVAKKVLIMEYTYPQEYEVIED